MLRELVFNAATLLCFTVTVFAGEGEAVLTSQIFPDHAAPRLSLFSEGANAEVTDLKVWTLSSIWTVPK